MNQPKSLLESLGFNTEDAETFEKDFEDFRQCEDPVTNPSNPSTACHNNNVGNQPNPSPQQLTMDHYSEFQSNLLKAMEFHAQGWWASDLIPNLDLVMDYWEVIADEEWRLPWIDPERILGIYENQDGDNYAYFLMALSQQVTSFGQDAFNGLFEEDDDE